MMGIWLPGGGVVHLAVFRGPGLWTVRCNTIGSCRPMRLSGGLVQWNEDTPSGPGRVVEFGSLADSGGLPVCLKCLRSYVRADAALWFYMEDIGQHAAV